MLVEWLLGFNIYLFFKAALHDILVELHFFFLWIVVELHFKSTFGDEILCFIIGKEAWGSKNGEPFWKYYIRRLHLPTNNINYVYQGMIDIIFINYLCFVGTRILLVPHFHLIIFQKKEYVHLFFFIWRS